MKKIALTGGTGFIGQYLLEELVSRNYSIVVLSRRHDFSGVWENDNISYVYCDNTYDGLKSAIKGCSALIHLGGMIPGNRMVESDFADACIKYIGYTKNVFEACRNCNIGNVVFGSSIAVYGNKGTEAYVESQKCEPNSLYGVAKLSIEKLAGYYHDKYGMNIKSMRLSQVFGARKDIVRPFLKMCVENSLKKIPLTIFGTGMTSQDYIYVRDAVHGICLALSHEELFGEFNIGIGRPVTTLELAQAHCYGFENDAGIVFKEHEEEKMFTRSLDITKAKQQLGYMPLYTLQQACSEMYRIYKNC